MESGMGMGDVRVGCAVGVSAADTTLGGKDYFCVEQYTNTLFHNTFCF